MEGSDFGHCFELVCLGNLLCLAVGTPIWRRGLFGCSVVRLFVIFGVLGAFVYPQQQPLRAGDMLTAAPPAGLSAGSGV